MGLPFFKPFSSLLWVLLFMLMTISCDQREVPKTETKKTETSTTSMEEPIIEMPEYSILNEDVYDVPSKTQVTLNVLVSGKISKIGLTNLLNRLYSKTQDRSGFKYHSHPTHIGIYAYTNKEYAQAGLGQWIAMLLKIGEEGKPEITINERQVAQIGAKPEEKFGLPEDTRKRIWAELIEAERRATREAEQRYPLPDPLKSNYSASYAGKQLEKQSELSSFLNEKYEKEIAKKYGLTREQLNEIAIEAVTKDWPYPADDW
ncbi:MAG: hypothetical protein OEV55_02360 [candidate division Zixibacteria bacterium]|nr:hypothetical protein [candidate division Zixibacteria bacterium]